MCNQLFLTNSFLIGNLAITAHLFTIFDRIKCSYQLLGCSGSSMIFEKGVQVQADYGNSTDCFIMAGEYVYAEAVKLAPIRAKRGNFSEFRTFEIASACFSGPIQRALVRRPSKLSHLFHHPCGTDSFLLLMACKLTMTLQRPCRQIFTALHL